MLKKLTRHGNSLALVIDKGVLDVLNIDAGIPLEKANTKYGRDLKRLA